MSEDPESFLRQEPLVNNLMKMLDDVASSNKAETQGLKKQVEKKIDDEHNIDDFIVTDNGSFYSLSKSLKKSLPVNQIKTNINKLTCVRQFEEDEEERAKMHRELEFLANNFRRLGNHSYGNAKFSDALYFYSKGIEYVPDTPVLYCNRGLCYIKLAKYKRALMDFNLVINKIDQNCLRAWLYRAGCYWRMGDEVNFEKSVYFARQYNMNDREYIAAFIERMKTEL